MPTLYIMCGPSGCGKTTWASEIASNNENVHHISRDSIRFSMVKDTEKYFAHEKDVFNKFVNVIVSSLLEGYDVIADATHLTTFSRRKLINAIDRYTTDYEIIFVVPNISVLLCLERNKKREGREQVPAEVIEKMCADFMFPSINEDYRVKEVMEID